MFGASAEIDQVKSELKRCTEKVAKLKTELEKCLRLGAPTHIVAEMGEA